MLSLNFGNKNETKPHTHCDANKITTTKPNHECKLYKLGIGGVAKLCESNTAFNATIANINANICIKACATFT